MLRIKDGDEHRPKRSADVSDRRGVSPAEGGVGPSRAGLTWLGFGCPQDLFMVLSMQKKKKTHPLPICPSLEVAWVLIRTLEIPSFATRKE